MCARDRPCGGILRLLVAQETHEVHQCLNGHTHIVGTPPRLRSEVDRRTGAKLTGNKLTGNYGHHKTRRRIS